MLAPPVSVHPPPSKLPGVSPGANVYQLPSPAERYGWDSCGFVHADVSIGVFGLGLASAGVTAKPARTTAIPALRLSDRGLKRFFVICTHLPWCVLAAELS